jgi:hypothetical protein
VQILGSTFRIGEAGDAVSFLAQEGFSILMMTRRRAIHHQAAESRAKRDDEEWQAAMQANKTGRRCSRPLA